MKTKKLIGLIGSIILLIGVSSFVIIRIASAKFEVEGFNGKYIGDEDSHAGKIILSQLEGEWLNNNYIETLQSTKSPREAVTGNSFVHIEISKKDDSYQLLLIWNFHEGIPYNILELLPTSAPDVYQLMYQPIYIRPVSRPDSIKRNLVIRFENSVKEIVWPSSSVFDTSEGPVTFRQIEQKYDGYVNRIVLAGSYIDERGREFVFSESGEAQWPNETFKYNIGLSYVHDKHDFFFLSGRRDKQNRPLLYSFSWENGKLYIFNTYYPDDPYINPDFWKREEKPLHVLTPR